MLAQRRRRWANIGTTMDELSVFAGIADHGQIIIYGEKTIILSPAIERQLPLLPASQQMSQQMSQQNCPNAVPTSGR